EIDSRRDCFEWYMARDGIVLTKSRHSVENTRARLGGDVNDAALRDRVSEPLSPERYVKGAVEGEKSLAGTSVADDEANLLVFEHALDERARVEPRVH